MDVKAQVMQVLAEIAASANEGQALHVLQAVQEAKWSGLKTAAVKQEGDVVVLKLAGTREQQVAFLMAMGERTGGDRIR